MQNELFLYLNSVNHFDSSNLGILFDTSQIDALQLSQTIHKWPSNSDVFLNSLSQQTNKHKYLSFCLMPHSSLAQHRWWVENWPLLIHDHTDEHQTSNSHQIHKIASKKLNTNLWIGVVYIIHSLCQCQHIRFCLIEYRNKIDLSARLMAPAWEQQFVCRLHATADNNNNRKNEHSPFWAIRMLYADVSVRVFCHPRHNTIYSNQVYASIDSIANRNVSTFPCRWILFFLFFFLFFFTFHFLIIMNKFC